MGRWEYEGAKFWEATQDGALVTVRFGRLGTAGQTRTKEHASAQAAGSALAKLVAEKQGKGYRPADAPPVEREQPPLPDEDTFVLPNAWLRHLHPRRGGVAVPVPPVDPEAAAGLDRAFAKEAARINACLDHPFSDPDLAAAGHRYLAGEPDPVGAAAVHTVAAADYSWRSANPVQLDGWIAAHGPQFAASAAMHVHTVEVSRRRVQPRGWSDLFLAPSSPAGNYGQPNEPNLVRLRSLLSVADEASYRAVTAEIGRHRINYVLRTVGAFLVPARTDWVEECCAETQDGVSERLLCALGSFAQLSGIGYASIPGWHLAQPHILYTLAEAIGPAIGPSLTWLLDLDLNGGDNRRLLLGVLAALPTDEAFQLLLDRLDQKLVQPALLTAAQHYPVRALRMLAEAAGRPGRNAATARRLLTGHVLGDPDLVARVRPDLPESARVVVSAVLDRTDRAPDAPVEALPTILSTPPWTRKRAAIKPVVIEGLSAGIEPHLDWAPGEQAAWAATTHPYGSWRPRVDFRGWADACWANQGRDERHDGLNCLLFGPEGMVRPLLPVWRGTSFWDGERIVRMITAKYDEAALPVIVQTARANPRNNAVLLAPVVGAEAAALVAGWLATSRTARPAAIDWLARHADAAARLLIPPALGKPGPQRRQAETALRYLATHGFAAEVDAAACAHGPTAAEAITALLAIDPLDLVPVKVPTVGQWADPNLLPQVLLADKRTALPTASVAHLLTVLALSTPDNLCPGFDSVRETCDADSLAEFGWAVFESWRANGSPAKDGWALSMLGPLGNDDTVRRLTPMIKAWPGEGGHARAVTGLDVLAAIGSDVALLHLNTLAQKVKFKGLRARAQDKIAQVADELGLSPDELADRLVPTFGLDDEATLTLDYGTRRFRIGFDEQLKPFVADAEGNRRKDLPKPGARDDADLAPAEYKRFAALKKDVRTVAGDQILRLEAAMVNQRRWSAASFRELFVGHPLLWHIVRRLVWSTEINGVAGPALRIAEDRTFADRDDDEFALPEDALVGVAHPVLLGADVPVWAELFADYEILQPFPQLGRAVHEPTEDERRTGRFARFEGRTVSTGKVLGLQRHGWQRCEPQDGGVEPWISRPVAGGRSLTIWLDPGIPVGAIDIFPEQKLDSIWFNAEGADRNWPHPRNATGLRALDPVLTSELLADLTELTS